MNLIQGLLVLLVILLIVRVSELTNQMDKYDKFVSECMTFDDLNQLQDILSVRDT